MRCWGGFPAGPRGSSRLIWGCLARRPFWAGAPGWLLVPFACVGLGLMHAVLGRFPGGSAWIVAVYLGLLGAPAFLGWRALLIFTLMLAGVGSADQLVDFRDLRGLRSGMKRK